MQPPFAGSTRRPATAEATEADSAWITRVSAEPSNQQQSQAGSGPLDGLHFAVKDNLVFEKRIVHWSGR